MRWPPTGALGLINSAKMLGATGHANARPAEIGTSLLLRASDGGAAGVAGETEQAARRGWGEAPR